MALAWDYVLEIDKLIIIGKTTWTIEKIHIHFAWLMIIHIVKFSRLFFKSFV